VTVTGSIATIAVLACVTGGCVEKGRSLVLVDVTADAPLPITHVQVVVTMAGSTRQWQVEHMWMGSSLNLGVYLPADVQGDVSATVCGYGATGGLAASGAGTPATVAVSPGAQSAEVAVDLKAGAGGASNCHCTDGHGDAGSASSGGGCISVAPADTLQTVDLTKEGTIDWAHWGYPDQTGFNHKLTGGNKIKNVSPDPASIAEPSPTFSWTDGTPTLSGTAMNGVYRNYGGSPIGFSWTVDAAPTTQTLRLYIGVGTSGDPIVISSNLHLALSDGSAAPVDYTIDPNNGATDVVFNAASAGQTLQLTWTWTSTTGGTMLLDAATLF
jgi:hypothetical protein